MPTSNRGPAASPKLAACAHDKAKDALLLMIEALELIDASEGAGVAGAHLDLAIHRLQEWIDGKPSI
jgi:hypothetical protein